MAKLSIYDPEVTVYAAKHQLTLMEAYNHMKMAERETKFPYAPDPDLLLVTYVKADTPEPEPAPENRGAKLKGKPKW